MNELLNRGAAKYHKLSVIQSDIHKANCQWNMHPRSQHCPIANALFRTMGLPIKEIEVSGFLHVRVKDKMYNLGESGKKLMIEWDKRRGCVPQTIELIEKVNEL